MKWKASPNYSNSDMEKIGVVLHSTLGSYKGALSWLTSPKSQVSAHYLVGREEGESVQMVKNEDMAWHAGVISLPSKRFKSFAKKSTYSSTGYTNPNLYMIGIEFAAGYDINKDGKVTPDEFSLTEWQYEEGVRIIQEEIGFDLKKEHLITHRDVAVYKPDMENVYDEFMYRLYGSPDEQKRKALCAIIKSISDKYCNE